MKAFSHARCSKLSTAPMMPRSGPSIAALLVPCLAAEQLLRSGIGTSKEEMPMSTPPTNGDPPPAGPSPTEPVAPPAEEPTVTRWDSERRKSALASAVANEVRQGWHVQSQSDYQAVMIKEGTKVNHILHLILTLITLGLWAIVWIILAVTHKREKREVISVDEYGNTNIQR
jgi:hypothetical protein